MSSRTHALALTMATAACAICSCRTATQVTVTVIGRGFSCDPGDGDVWRRDVGVLAQGSFDALRADASRAGSCAVGLADGSDPEALDFGSVVLIPGNEVSRLEVLAIGALGARVDGVELGATIDECRAVYARVFDATDPQALCDQDPTCGLCIFARRSLSFVSHSKLSLELELDNDCRGVLCEASETCKASQCVSAETTCPDSGQCELEVGGGGSPGGGGADGGGGGEAPAGGGGAGAGGEGGGLVCPGLAPGWTTYQLAGAVPSVVDVLDAGVLQSDPVRVYAAADTEIVTFENGCEIARHQGAAASYRALARHAADPAIALAIGRFGVSTDQSPIPFATVVSPSAIFPTDRFATHFSVAAGVGGSSHWAFTDGNQGFSTFEAQNNERDGAVFGVSTARGPVVGGMFHGEFHIADAAGTAQGTVSTPSNVWHLWGAEDLQNGGATFYAIGTTTAAAYQFYWPGPGASGGATQLVGLPGYTVLDLWGDAPGGVPRLWAVGTDASGAPWLGAAVVVLPPSSLQWVPLSVPPGAVGAQDLTSIWVGSGRVVVGGALGVHSAPIEFLAP